MTQASVFLASIMGVALVMTIVVFCNAWSVFKQSVKCRRQAYLPRKNLMEYDIFISITGLLCSVVTLLLYLVLISLVFLFNKITVGLFLGAVILSTAIGVGLFFIIKMFQNEIEDNLTRIKLKI